MNDVTYTEMDVYWNGLETPKAYKFTFYDDEPEEEELWVPKSVIEEHICEDDVDRDNKVKVSVADWFLRENGLIDFEDETYTRECY